MHHIPGAAQRGHRQWVFAALHERCEAHGDLGHLFALRRAVWTVNPDTAEDRRHGAKVPTRDLTAAASIVPPHSSKQCTALPSSRPDILVDPEEVGRVVLLLRCSQLGEVTAICCLDP